MKTTLLISAKDWGNFPRKNEMREKVFRFQRPRLRAGRGKKWSSEGQLGDGQSAENGRKIKKIVKI